MKLYKLFSTNNDVSTHHESPLGMKAFLGMKPPVMGTSIQDRLVSTVNFATMEGRAHLAQQATVSGNAGTALAHVQEILKMAENAGMSPKELASALSGTNPALANQAVESYQQHLAMKQESLTPGLQIGSAPTTPVATL